MYKVYRAKGTQSPVVCVFLCLPSVRKIRSTPAIVSCRAHKSWISADLCPHMVKVGIFKRKQESKTTRKHSFDKKVMKKKDRFLGRTRVFFYKYQNTLLTKKVNKEKDRFLVE